MAAKENNCKKSTLYISISISLLIGFVAGVLYSAYQTPAMVSNNGHNQGTAPLIESLQNQVKTSPDDLEAWIKLGHAYFDSDQYAQAIDAYQKALTIAPGNTNVMTDMGVMYRRNGQPEIAVETFDKVLELDPNHSQARFNKGVVLLGDLNDAEAAVKEWKILVMNNPEAATPSGKPLVEIIKEIEGTQTAE
jgi:cytochrome c-type biogenesis protein CcmH/NrfG